MPQNTRPSGTRGAVLAAVGTVLVIVLFVGSLLWTMVESGAVPAAAGMMIVCGVFGAAVVMGVLAALGQRLREIRGGEEDEARKY